MLVPTQLELLGNISGGTPRIFEDLHPEVSHYRGWQRVGGRGCGRGLLI